MAKCIFLRAELGSYDQNQKIRSPKAFLLKGVNLSQEKKTESRKKIFIEIKPQKFGVGKVC
jgi:hypothetical protein